MKKAKIVLWALSILILGTSVPVEAQILKGFGKRLEKKLEQRIERKADRQVDKVLDKADRKTDESIENVFTKPTAGSADQKQTATGSGMEQVAARPDQAIILLGDNCTDFSWFRKGAVLAYEALDDKGKVEGGIEMRVSDLTSEGTMTIARIDATMSSPNFEDLTYPMNYICDGDMIYMDIGSMMKAMMEKNPEMKNQAVQDAFNNMEIDFDNGFASFPKTMYPGMVLDDLSFSFSTKVGTSEMAFRSQVTDRQVLARETVTTKAGTFECLKISSVTRVSVNVMGVNQAMPETTEYLWVAPGVGMVKQETHGKNESTSMQLKTLKL